MRFLPEKSSFATEVLVHRKLWKVGVKVPQVIHFEDKNKMSGFSLMILDEVPGTCVEDENPRDLLKSVLNNAGKELALLHTIPVKGFGWINKESNCTLEGEKHTFDAYFCEFLEHDLDKLNEYDFSTIDRNKFRNYMYEAREKLNVSEAVLVHGDFDMSHVFHDNGVYSGIIDFGEVRGNNPLYDLATFYCLLTR